MTILVDLVRIRQFLFKETAKKSPSSLLTQIGRIKAENMVPSISILSRMS